MGSPCIELFDGFRCILAELVATFIFVFAGQGSVLAFASLSSNGSLTPAGLTSVAVGHAFALFAAVTVAANVSGGHVNPAVTFALFLGGRIGFASGLSYWIAQLVGSIAACSILAFIVTDVSISPPSLSNAESVYGGLMLEIVLTFGLVYTVLATTTGSRDRGQSAAVGLLAPLAIGLVVGTNILVGGAFDGASMNPALAFGPALISWDFTNQWLYWIGPLVGAALATLIHDTLLDPHSPFHSSIEQ